MDELKAYLKEPAAKRAMRFAAVILTLIAVVSLWRWIDDPPNADPRLGRVYIYDGGAMWDEDYDHYTQCIGAHLYERYDELYDDQNDKEIKTSYAEECER